MKKFKIKNINQKNNFLRKIFVFCLFFIGGIFVFNLQETSFWADIVSNGKGLLSQQEFGDKLDEIGTVNVTWPLKDVTDWGKVINYETTKYTQWNNLNKDKKAQFPQNISNEVRKYKHISPYNVWGSISNPYERKKVIFLKRLITASWSASYNCNQSSCDRWKKDTGTHAGIDFVSSIGTPVYSSMDGVVLRTESNGGSSYGNYIVVATEIDNEIYAHSYGHLEKINSSISEGDIITQGDRIGSIGNSGNSTAPHLHFQINKLGAKDDILNINYAQKFFQGLDFDTIEDLKDNTVNPISFIEDYQNVSETENENVDDMYEKDDTGIGDQIVGQGDDIDEEIIDKGSHPSAGEPFRMKDIQTSKIDNKLFVGDVIEIDIYTSGKDGEITIDTNNDALSPDTHLISGSDEKEKYTISFKAQDVGSSRIVINDGESREVKSFRIYKDNAGIHGLSISGANSLYTTRDTKFYVNPVDEYGLEIEQDIKGSWEVLLLDSNGNEKTILNKDNSELDTFTIKPDKIDNYKLRVYFEDAQLSLMASKSLNTEIFVDYSINDNYGNSIKELYQKGIIQGSNGRLMPQNKLSRGEIVTILVRHKYGDKFEKFKKDMEEYMTNNNGFLEDVDGSEWWAPYMFKAYQDGVIKGANNKAFGQRNVTKAELVTIYGRFFGVEKQDSFSRFWDIEYDWYKSYANAAGNYNLYPFERDNYFQPNEKVSRLKAFESLNRYMDFDRPELAHNASDENDQETNKNNETESQKIKESDEVEKVDSSNEELQKLIEDLME